MAYEGAGRQLLPMKQLQLSFGNAGQQSNQAEDIFSVSGPGENREHG